MKELREIYLNYGQDIYRYFYGLSLDPTLSEDLTSDVFLEAVKSLHTFKENSDIKTWLFSIARHIWYHHLRKKKNQPLIIEDCIDFIIDENSSESNISDRALYDRINEIIKEQPQRTQEIMNMRIQGFSYYEISIKLGISENSARVIEFRTKNKIKQILKKEGFIDE